MSVTGDTAVAGTGTLVAGTGTLVASTTVAVSGAPGQRTEAQRGI